MLQQIKKFWNRFLSGLGYTEVILFILVIIIFFFTIQGDKKESWSWKGYHEGISDLHNTPYEQQLEYETKMENALK